MAPRAALAAVVLVLAGLQLAASDGPPLSCPTERPSCTFEREGCPFWQRRKLDPSVDTRLAITDDFLNSVRYQGDEGFPADKNASDWRETVRYPLMERHTLLRLRTALREAAAANPQATAVVTYADQRVYTHLVNLFASLIRAELRESTVVFALDEFVARESAALGFRAFLVPEYHRHSTLGKFFIVYNCLRTGVDIMVLEADTVVFENPLPAVPPRCDLTMTSDAYAHSDIDKEDVNIGVFHARSVASTPYVANIFLAFMLRYDPELWDQAQFNELVKNRTLNLGLTLCLLDLHKFPNGGLAGWLAHTLPPDVSFSVLHNNFVEPRYKLDFFFSRGWWGTGSDGFYWGGRKFLAPSFDLRRGTIADQLHMLRMAALVAFRSGRTLVYPHVTCLGHPGYTIFSLHQLPHCEVDYWFAPLLLQTAMDARPARLLDDPNLLERYAPRRAALAPGAGEAPAPFDTILARVDLVFLQDVDRLYDWTTAPLVPAAYLTMRILCQGMRSWQKDVREAGGEWDVPLQCGLEERNFWRWRTLRDNFWLTPFDRVPDLIEGHGSSA
eukprot:tig00020603_g11783.t1